MIDYSLLGPLEARRDESPVELPGGKARAVLARLLLDAGRVVPADTLIDAIWETPPPSAHKVLQAHVSQLRKALGADAIETQPPGYRVRAGASDLARFESLTESAGTVTDPERRAHLYRDALALWSDTPLAEFRREPFAAAAGRRLNELRLDALGRRIEADLSLGQHQRLVAELEELVGEEPLREQLRRQLMLALYRCGRQADALACYREGRNLLVEELGIEPGPALQELERAILRHDIATEPRVAPRGAVLWTGAVPFDLVAQLAADGRELILVEIVRDPAALAGRSAELERARAALPARARTACFTSDDPGGDLVRLAAEQECELIVAGGEYELQLAEAPCDVATLLRPVPFTEQGPVLVPFGGGRDEWAALELGAWLARAHDLPLRLLGTEATDGRRDASRMLAGASLVLQRFAGIGAQTAIVAAGATGILAEQGSVIVVSHPRGPLDRTRQTLVERSDMPVLLVRNGLRPGGLAPDRTLTRFSWSLAVDSPR